MCQPVLCEDATNIEDLLKTCSLDARIELLLRITILLGLQATKLPIIQTVIDIVVCVALVSSMSL